MDDWQQYLHMAVKILFILVIPGIALFFRFKKKIKTGFAVGIMLTSFVLGIIASASIQKNPLEEFYYSINNNFDEAKSDYKIIVQYGPEMLEKIDESRIIYKDKYELLKKELIGEYSEIAQRYANLYTVSDTGNCKDLLTQKYNFQNLENALQLVEYSESIGGKHSELKTSLENKIRKYEPIIAGFEEKCE
ncbi:MAG TPA: hypothetical protein PK926_01500 [Spirochaetota bacterium]|nr:hypothetical protein [Spirochaetota bacterium]HPI88067.1 hypothetical protein [Spirochaetota bacterium]HPR46448.1 hypothetical protein [Spirochaetota bacterium]